MAGKRKNPTPWLFIGGGLLLVVAGLAWNYQKNQNTAEATPTPASVDEVLRVSLADAKAALDAGEAVFLDVRDSGSFERSHIPRAINIPTTDMANQLSQLNPTSWIITYCT